MQHPNHTQGIPSSSSSNPDLEAMKSAQNAAIVSNERVFPLFAKKLASKDPKDFANTARKLVQWLSSEKAYYPAARPKIVELLEIALSAFMDTFVHNAAVAEFAELLRELVCAIVPFQHLFPEHELQSRLQRVIIDTERSLATVSERGIPTNVPPQGAVTDNSPSLVSPVNVHLQLQIPPVPGPQQPMLQIQRLSAPGSAAKAFLDGSVHVDAPRARNPPEISSGQTDADQSLASPIINAPREPGENTSPSIPPKLQPRRARRAELSEALIARDLDWFKSNASAIVNEDQSKAGESGTVKRLPSPKKKTATARMVPSRRFPRRIPLNTVQNAELGALPPPSEPPTADSEIAQDTSVLKVHEQQSSPEMAASDGRSAAILETHDVREVSLHEELPSPMPHPVVISLNEPPIEPEIPLTDYHLPSAKALSPNGESTIPPRSFTQPLETAAAVAESMDTSVSDLDCNRVLSESPRKPGSAPPQSPQVLQLQSPVLPPLVGALEPPLNLNFNISHMSSGQRQRSAMDADERRFDGDMTIIHSMQGKPFTHTHMIDITLEESVFTKISLWVNRRSQPSEAPHGICFSLGCYHLPDFFDKIKPEVGKPDIETLTLRSSCSWPYSNQLSLHVNEETRYTTVTLSPPLFLTPDQCVDISSLMKPGSNTLEIRQQGDLSECLVVLHAHRPTLAQLSELDVVKIADERWKRFLDVLSARVVPGKVLGTPPAGIVGVF